MDPTVPVLDASPQVNVNTNCRSAYQRYENVFALLDEERSRQLVQRVIPAVTYTGAFEIVGRDDGLDPPTQLCSPCKRFIQQPPPMYWRGGILERSVDFTSSQFWISHHDTLFQLVDCCFSRIGSCRLCQLLWHGIRRETVKRRSRGSENLSIHLPDDGLKVALYTNGSMRICLNIILGTSPRLCESFFHIRMVESGSFVRALETTRRIFLTSKSAWPCRSGTASLKGRVHGFCLHL